MTPILMLLKASVVVAATAVALGLFGRRASAASRHLMCTLAIGGLLVLPVLSWALPGWEAVQLTALRTAGAAALISSESSSVMHASADSDRSDGVIAVPLEDSDAKRPALSVTWSMSLLALYAAGVLLVLLRLIVQRWSIRRLALHAAEMSDPEWRDLFDGCVDRAGVRRPVRLLRSREHTMPMATGVRNGAILVPAVADTWSADRRRAVLLHELAHIARHDCLTQTFAAVACALYWMHPGVWWMARRLRVERELASDDFVLAAGADARDYAGHLLELAYALRGHPAMATAVSMVSPRQLEGRLLAVLDAAKNRTAPALRSHLAGVAILAALIVPIAGATAGSTPPAADDTGSGSRGAVERALSRQDRFAAGAPANPQLPGTWEIRPTKDPAILQLQFREERGSHGFTLNIDRLTGLRAAQLTGSGGPVQFSLRRDAGTFTFEGIVRQGVGAGTFDFEPNDTFADELVRRGMQRPTPADYLPLARADIGFAFLDELSAQGHPRPGLPQLILAAEHGVSLSYLRDMARLGYRLSLDDLLQARDHGVSPEYINGLRALGYRSLDLEQLMTLRNHGVSPEYIRGLDEAGLRKLSLETLIEARNHGISPEYVRELQDLGYPFTIEELENARGHGISASYIREMSALGYTRLSLEDLVRLRSHGVEPDYVRELQSLGYTRLDIADLEGLRSHGVTPEQVRRANTRFGTRLTVDRLKTLAAHGWQ